MTQYAFHQKEPPKPVKSVGGFFMLIRHKVTTTQNITMVSFHYSRDFVS